MGCSHYAVVITVPTKSGSRKGHGQPRFMDTHGKGSLAHLVRSHRRGAVAQIAEKCNAGHDRKVLDRTLHHSLLYMGLHSH